MMKIKKQVRKLGAGLLACFFYITQNSNSYSQSATPPSLEYHFEDIPRMELDIPQKNNYLAEIIEDSANREVYHRFFAGSSVINNTFRFFSAPRTEKRLDPLEFNAREGSKILKSIIEEVGRSFAAHSVGLGGLAGEIVNGNIYSSLISSPFNPGKEGDPGTIYNPQAKNHFSLGLFNAWPFASFKRNFGEETQLNLRVDFDGVETILARDVGHKSRIVMGAKLGEYNSNNAEFYAGFRRQIDSNALFQAGATLSNNIRIWNSYDEPQRKAGCIVTAALLIDF